MGLRLQIAFGIPQTNIVDVHISKLRRELDAGGAKPLIETVRGAGYMMSDCG